MMQNTYDGIENIFSLVCLLACRSSNQRDGCLSSSSLSLLCVLEIAAAVCCCCCCCCRFFCSLAGDNILNQLDDYELRLIVKGRR